MTVTVPMSELPGLLAQARLEAALGSDFDVMAENDTVAFTLRLIEVNPRPSPRGYEQYSAIFKGPTEPAVPQATYALRHPDFGMLPLFIVPIACDSDGFVYEACVVRRVAPPGAAPA